VRARGDHGSWRRTPFAVIVVEAEGVAEKVHIFVLIDQRTAL
jgi:hypothetical protein